MIVRAVTQSSMMRERFCVVLATRMQKCWESVDADNRYTVYFLGKRLRSLGSPIKVKQHQRLDWCFSKRVLALGHGALED